MNVANSTAHPCQPSDTKIAIPIAAPHSAPANENARAAYPPPAATITFAHAASPRRLHGNATARYSFSWKSPDW